MSVNEEQNQRLDEIRDAIKALEEEQSNIYERSLHGPESEKVCEDWMADMLSDPPFPNLLPVQVRGMTQGKDEAMHTPPSKLVGSFVAIRPCDKQYENRTYLGMYLGDLATGIGLHFAKDIGVMEVSFSGHNPAIWVFDLNRIVRGCESWWGKIKSENQLREITDGDIENIWYVKALKDMHGDSNAEAAGPDGDQE